MMIITLLIVLQIVCRPLVGSELMRPSSLGDQILRSDLLERKKTVTLRYGRFGENMSLNWGINF